MKSWTAPMSLVTRVIRSPVRDCVVFGERQPLNVVVQRPPQVVSHPLADARGQVFLEVGADRADDRNERDRGDGEVHDRAGVLAEQPGHDPAEHRRKLLRLQNVVDDDLDGPRLEDVRERFAQHGDQRDGQRLPVRPNQVDDPQSSRGHRPLKCARSKLAASVRNCACCLGRPGGVRVSTTEQRDCLRSRIVLPGTGGVRKPTGFTRTHGPCEGGGIVAALVF